MLKETIDFLIIGLSSAQSQKMACGIHNESLFLRSAQTDEKDILLPNYFCTASDKFLKNNLNFLFIGLHNYFFIAAVIRVLLTQNLC